MVEESLCLNASEVACLAAGLEPSPRLIRKRLRELYERCKLPKTVLAAALGLKSLQELDHLRHGRLQNFPRPLAKLIVLLHSLVCLPEQEKIQSLTELALWGRLSHDERAKGRPAGRRTNPQSIPAVQIDMEKGCPGVTVESGSPRKVSLECQPQSCKMHDV